MQAHDTEHCLPAAKFAPFPVRVPIPVRPRLLDLLERVADHRVIVVRGSVGAGKTTLLAHLLARRRQAGQAGAWISLDAADRTPSIFLRSFAHAAREAGLGIDAQAIAAAAAMADQAPEIAVRMLAAAARLPRERALILMDNYDAVIGTFAELLTSSCLRYWGCLHIVIAARAPLSSELGWLRQAGEVYEVQPSDLNLNLQEIRSLFRDLLPDEYAGLMLAKTDGAPVAANFAHEALSQHSRQATPEHGRQSARTWRDSLNDFYRERLFEPLPEEARNLITRLAIVEEFDASLAHTISGSRAAATIERLYVVEGLLLRRPRSGWFHFPEPLREFLVDRLQWIEDAERVDLHAKASAWFAVNGYLEQALVHAVAARDSKAVTELFEKIGGCGLSLRHGLSILRAIVLQVPVTEAHRPLLKLSEAMLLAQEGHLSEARLALSSVPKPDCLDLRADNPIAREYVLVSGLLSAYLDQPAEADILYALQDVLPSEDHANRGFVSNLLCGAAYQSADFAGADAACSQAVMEYAASNSAYGSVFMHLHRITIRYWQNDLAGALSEAAAAETLLQLFFPVDARLRALTSLYRDLVRFDAGLPVDHVEFLEQTLPEIAEREGWVDAQVLAHQLAVKVACQLGDVEAIESVLERGLHTAQRIELPRLQWQIRTVAIELKLWAGQFDEAQELIAAGAWCGSDAREQEFLGWKERSHTHVLRARLALAQRDLSRARMEIAALEAMCDRDIPRVRVKVSLLTALLSFACGDLEAARLRCIALVPALGTLPSTQLFREEGALCIEMLHAILATTLPEGVERTLRIVLGEQAIAGQDLRGSRRKGILTAREREVLAVMSEGRPNKIAAFEIGLSEATLKFHLRNIYKKLNARNRTEAVARFRSLEPDAVE